MCFVSHDVVIILQGAAIQLTVQDPTIDFEARILRRQGESIVLAVTYLLIHPLFWPVRVNVRTFVKEISGGFRGVQNDYIACEHAQICYGP